MRRMFSENQIKKLAKFVAINDLGDVDLNVASINAKGMAITGAGAITGNLAVGGAITGNSIIENMSGYTLQDIHSTTLNQEYYYGGVVKNGNKLTFAVSFKITPSSTISGFTNVCQFKIPKEIGAKLFPSDLGAGDYLDYKMIPAFSGPVSTVNVIVLARKGGTVDEPTVYFTIYGGVQENVVYYLRIESTFLLSENLAPTE